VRAFRATAPGVMCRGVGWSAFTTLRFLVAFALCALE
jgi:hypothetical protein